MREYASHNGAGWKLSTRNVMNNSTTQRSSRLGILVRTVKLAGLASATLFAFSWPALGDTGIEAWVRHYQGQENIFVKSAQANALALDGDGNLIVSGEVEGLQGLRYRNFATIKYSPSGVPLWTNRYTSGSGSDCQAQAVAVDREGNVIVTGDVNGTLGRACAILKYSAAGVPLWTNAFARGGFTAAAAVVTDTNNNIFVAGTSVAYVGQPEYTTIKYSNTGQPLWTNYFRRTGYMSYAKALALDGNGNVIVAGYSLSGDTYIHTAIKYANSGTPLWTNSYAYSHGTPSTLAADATGAVILTGRVLSGTNSEYVTLKYSASGTPLWTNRYGAWPGNSRDDAQALAVDGSGNIFVTGASVAPGSVNYDFATIKYTSSGLPLWTNRYNGTGNSNDIAHAVAVDRQGSVFVSGYSWSSATDYDFVTIKYANGGVPLWTNRLNRRGPLSPGLWRTSIAIDSDGAACVTGTTASSVGDEFTTVKYVSAPELQPLLGVGITDLTVSWTAVPDQAYQLQRNTDLMAEDWQVVTNVIATGALVSVTVSALPVGSRCVFRVLAP